MCNFAPRKQVAIMYQTSTNITSKYYQETHYNYVKNSGFWVSDCSPLLCYRFVTTALTAQIPTETLSQSHRLCFMLLHYHYVSTSLTMQIPTETLSQTHWVCFTQKQAFPTSEHGTMIRIFWRVGLVWIRLRISTRVCRLMLIVDGILSSWWTRLTMASQGLRRTIGFAKTTRLQDNESTRQLVVRQPLVVL